MKNTKISSKIFIITVIFAVGMFIGSLLNNSNAPKQSEQTVSATVWTCSMHPQIRQPEPGQCPICAMDLIPATSDNTNSDNTIPELKLGKAAIALADIETYEVTRGLPKKNMRLYGSIVIDETQKGNITAWFPGRIEKQYINYQGATIQKGDPLVKIYSPELFTAQKEYLATLNSPNSMVSAESAAKKLELLGLTHEQINEIKENNHAMEHITIKSPVNGIVLYINSREGNYVKTGSTIYEIAGLDQLWIELEAFESEISWINKGSQLTYSLDSKPGQEYHASIDFIEPVMKNGTRTSVIRSTINNKKGELKPGMYVTGEINTASSKANANELLIPASAPLLTGKRAIVYIQDKQDKGTFYGREVKLGSLANDMYVVKSGLNAGDNVVTKGNFKIDSALQLMGKTSMMSASMIGNMTMEHQHKETDHQTEHSMNSKTMNVKLPSMDSKQIKDLYSNYFELQKNLSLDNLAKSKTSAKHILNGLKTINSKNNALEKIENASQEIDKSESIQQARKSFHTISNVMIELANQKVMPENSNVYKVHCPMAFDNTGADWLQTHKEVENPYFGSQMYHCGSVEATLQESAKNNIDVENIYSSYFDLQKALSKDDLKNAQSVSAKLVKMLPKITSGSFESIKASAVSISISESIDEARTKFQPLSNAMIDLAKENKTPANSSLYIVHCPMAFNNTGADWLQTHKDVENPYFGSQMYRCGSVTGTLKENDKGEQ